MNLSVEAVEAFYDEQASILADEVMEKHAGLFSGAKKLFGRFVPKSRAGRVGAGLALGGGALGAGALGYKKLKSRKQAPADAKRVGIVPASAKKDPLFKRIVQKVKQRFPEIPGRNIPWLVYLAMKERGLVK